MLIEEVLLPGRHRTRKRCTEEGHRWVGYVNGWRLPVQYCERWGCKEERWDPWSGIGA